MISNENEQEFFQFGSGTLSSALNQVPSVAMNIPTACVFNCSTVEFHPKQYYTKIDIVA